jgi:predicted nucleotidyltransferase
MFTHQIKAFRTYAELMKENTIVKHYAGSLAYGTNLPSSDVDFRGIFCADPVNILTPFYTVRECEDVNEEDTKLYEMSHFFKLCLDCNPNIVETLWVDDSDITMRTEAYDYIREHRMDFLSSKIAFTTSGYALAQLKRIKGHNKWINNPQPEKAPQPKDHVSLVQYFGEDKMLKFNIEEWNRGHRLVHYGGDVYGVYKAHPAMTLYEEERGKLNVNFDGDRQDLPMPIMIVKYNKEVFKEFLTKHKDYWTWKKNRNEARSELEEHYGYDTKHAMHLVRLLRMGKEALEEGKIIVKRPDAEELLGIRNGSMTYEEVVDYAEYMDDLVRKKLYKTTDLPKKPDLKKVAQLLMNTQYMVWGWKE